MVVRRSLTTPSIKRYRVRQTHNMTTQPSVHPRELSFPLPKALHTTVHVHLTVLETCVMVFVTASTPGDTLGLTKPMGSFVYAMPDVSFLFSSCVHFTPVNPSPRSLAHKLPVCLEYYTLHLDQHRVHHSNRQDSGTTVVTAGLRGL